MSRSSPEVCSSWLMTNAGSGGSHPWIRVWSLGVKGRRPFLRAPPSPICRLLADDFEDVNESSRNRRARDVSIRSAPFLLFIVHLTFTMFNVHFRNLRGIFGNQAVMRTWNMISLREIAWFTSGSF